MASESKFQSTCITHLKQLNIYYVNVHGGGWTGKGTPDLLVCSNGRFIAFELKVGNNTLQEDQKVRRNRILKNGGLFYSPTTIEEFKKIMEGLNE